MQPTRPPWFRLTRFFSFFFSIVSVFLKDKLRSRIVFLGTDHAALGRWIPAASVPRELGGELEWDHAAWLAGAP